MIEIYNHQYLWDNRQEPRVYDAFVDIWDREDLWVGIDRANLNPPKTMPGDARASSTGMSIPASGRCRSVFRACSAW